MKQNKMTVINLTTNIIYFIINILVGFFLSPYIIKCLGVEANGYAQLANNFVNYATLITLALNSMAGRFITIEYHNGKINEAIKYYSSLVVGNVIIILVLVFPAFILIRGLENYIVVPSEYINDVKLLFTWAFVNFFGNQISSLFSVSTYITNKLFYQNIISLISVVIKVVLYILLFWIFGAKMHFITLIGLVLTLVTIPVYFLLKKKLTPSIKFYKKEFRIKYIVRLVSSGIWNVVNQCGNLLMTGFDLLLSNIFINPLEMGMLSVAKTLPTYIIQLGAMVNNNFSPNLTITYATETDKNKILDNLRWGMKVSSILMSIPLAVFSVYGDVFYALWVPSLDAYKLTILSILTCMAFIPLSGTQVLYNVYTTTNKLRVNSLTVIVGGVVNICVVYLLLKFSDLGIYAVAGVSSIVSAVRNLIVTVPYTAKILKLKWNTFYRDVGISCICYILVCVVSIVIKLFVLPSGWVGLIISVLMSSGFGLGLEIIIFLNKRERNRLIMKMNRR